MKTLRDIQIDFKKYRIKMKNFEEQRVISNYIKISFFLRNSKKE